MNPQVDLAIDELRTTPKKLIEFASNYSTDVLKSRPFENKWTPLEILGHLVDHEIVTAYRIRAYRFENKPLVGPYDQELWVEKQEYNTRIPHDLIDTFSQLRELNLAQYSTLSPPELTTKKQRPDGKTTCLGDVICRHAEHDRGHLDQLDRYLTALASISS